MKGQISTNTIVGLIIALSALIIIVGFTTGGLGNLFSSVADSSPDKVDTYKSNCNNSCNTAKASVSNSGINTFPKSSYCTKQFVIDGEPKNCYQEPIFVDCSGSGRTESGEVVFFDGGNPAISLPGVHCGSIL